MMSEKISAHHRARKAVLYVRQSSAHQVQHNRESRILQYAMRDRLIQLGWSEIEIVDEDPALNLGGGDGSEPIIGGVIATGTDHRACADR